ncbi:hypothetical protein LLG95_08180 [bacterium]|nr:hypothetical protein [bacterium]
MVSFIRRILLAAMFVLIGSAAMAAVSGRPVGKHPVIKPVPPAGAWKTDFTSGIATLKSGDRPTLLMVSISSDPDCRKAKEMLADPAVQASLKNWNLLYDDTDCYARFEKVLWYRTVPFFVMFDKNGNEISRCGIDTPAEFKAWIDDIYERQAAVEKADAVLKTKPNDPDALGQKAYALIVMGLKMYNADIRCAVSMPERLDRAIAVGKQAFATGRAHMILRYNMAFAQTVVQALRGQLDAADKALAGYEKSLPDADPAFIEFWRIYITMVRNTSNPIRSHEPVSDKLFADYVQKYPDPRMYTDTARRKVASINAALAQEKADK